jgi:outer membrane protein assembly factor BamD
MKHLRVILFVVLLTVAGGGCMGEVNAAPKKPRLTKEERLREKEQTETLRATASIDKNLKKGRVPRYNILLKSTHYGLMYTEGLRYYNAKKKRKDYNSRSNYTKAQNLLDACLQSQAFVGSRREDSLAYFLGCSYYKAGDFSVSESIFDNFRRRYTNSIFLEDAEYMYAMGFYFASPEASYDQTLTIRAMNAIAEYEGRYPDTIKKKECDERMEELRLKLYAKSFENAELYFTIGQYRAAVRALSNAIDEYPETPYREDLMYLVTKSSYLLAKHSVTRLMADRYMAMMDYYYNFISDFPETEHRREVDRMHEEAKKYIEKHNIERENGN